MVVCIRCNRVPAASYCQTITALVLVTRYLKGQKPSQKTTYNCIIMVQSKDKRIHDMPERDNVVEANGVLPDETGGFASI
jgi:hypothetical protein